MPLSAVTPFRTGQAATKRFPHGLSVFFPAYNDAPSLPGLIAGAFEVLEREVADFEVIVINDGSHDDTAAVLDKLQRLHGERLRVVTHPENRGYGGALRSGFAAATKPFVFYTDGDGQYEIRELPRLLDQMAPDVGFVNGFKKKRNDPWHRIAIGFAYNKFARFLFRVRLRDIDCDYRLIRRSLLLENELRSTSGTICVELVKRLEASGMRVVEVPVSHYARVHGRSQFFRVKSLATTFSQICALYLREMLFRR